MYNGYKNWETWNVALWINNDEFLYGLAQGCESYSGFCDELRELCEGSLAIETPDRVAWNASSLDFDRLDELVHEDIDLDR